MRTDTELQDFSKYIIHDLGMLQQTVYILATRNTDDITVKTALMESALIHARCLIDFLYPPEKPKKDDITIQDYLNNTTPFNKSELITACKTRISKEIAHLTESRGKNGKWEMGIWRYLEGTK